MALFISYSSQDRSTVDALTTALRRGQQQVWFDQELGGGDSWWAKIVEQIRSCDVFVVALSNNWLQSKPSQSELRYAQALNRPILPVRIGEIDSMRVNPLAALQIIDYREPSVDAGIQLVTAVHALQSKPVPLPDPLPEEPPVPFGYITRLGNTLAEKELSPQQQLQLLVELRSGLDEDGDDPSARSDIDNVLASIASTESSPAAASAKPAAAEQPPTTPAQPGTGAQPVSSPAPARPPSTAAVRGNAAGGGSNTRLIVIGAAAAAVIAAIAVVVVLVTQGGKSKPAPNASGVSPAGPAGPANATRLDTYLLGAADIGTIVADPNLVAAERTVHLRTLRETLSNVDCLGAYEPIEEAVYQPSGYTEVRGQAVQTAGEDPAHRIFESVAAFPSAEKASAFVQTSADKWKACAGQQVTTTFNDKTSAWTFGALDGAAPRIAQERKPAEGTRTCHHVLHAASSVVIDVLVCGADVAAGQAGKIAGQIAAKVGQ